MLRRKANTVIFITIPQNPQKVIVVDEDEIWQSTLMRSLTVIRC
jgi:hypothetical protein